MTTRGGRQRVSIGLVTLLVVLASLTVPVGGIEEPNETTPSPTPAPVDTTAAANDTDETAENATAAEVTQRPTKSVGPLGDEDLTAPVAFARSASLADERVRVVVELDETPPATYREELRGRGARIEVEHDTLVQASLPTANLTAVEALPWVVTVRRPDRPTPALVSEGVTLVDADAVHAAGVSGAGVRVGVVDFGFDPSDPEIRDNVVASRSFTNRVATANDVAHGTAVSELVVDTAPNASLYLARVNTDVEFAAAVSWLRANDVDVVTMSLNWVNQPYDGTGFVSQVADEAVADGVVWTNSAGNYARRHWEGQYRNTDTDRWVEFTPNDERNYLNEGRAVSGRVGISLSWNDWPRSDDDYDLYLYRDVPPYGSQSRGEDILVARSTRAQTGSQRPTEFVGVTLDRGVYYVAVADYDADGSHVLELYGLDATGPFDHRVPESSLGAPATARDVIAVGAFNRVDGTVEPFSSRGPTNDGRRGVDIVGPDRVSTTQYVSFSGTSAAAPHVGGVSALIRERKPGASPADIERRLADGAVDIGAFGPDTTSGYGRLNATRAVFGPNDLGSIAIDSTRSSVIDAQDPSTAQFRGYHERVALSGVAGVRVSVTMQSGRGDPYLFLLAPNGSVVAWDDDGAAGLNASLVHTFERTGRYTVVAAGFGTLDTFPYDLSVTDAPPKAPVELVLSANATTVETGTAVTFTVTRADTGEPVTATLQYDETTVQTAPDGTATVTFDGPGSYQVTATAPPTDTERFLTDEVTVTVEPDGSGVPDEPDEPETPDEPDEPDEPNAPARFEVSSVSLPDTAQKGTHVQVSATVTNTGERRGTQLVRAGIDRDGDGTLEAVVDESVELAPGERYTVTRPVLIPRYLAPGTYLAGVWTANETVTTEIRVVERN